MDVPADENTMEDIEAEISKMLFDNRKRAIDAVKDGLPRCSSGNPKFPEDVWMAARQIVSAYDEAMAVAALILAERERCAQIAENNDYWPQEGADIAKAIRA